MAWDNQDFAAVFNDLYPGLCRFLECMLGGSGAAQDVAQESFLRLFRKGGASIPREEVRFWIYRVARNLALNELNKTRTRTSLVDRVRFALRPAAEHPEARYEQAELKDRVLGLLKSLPEHQRAALLLREQQELTYAEIARVLNVSEAKVKVDIHRARMNLRAKWNETQAEPAKAMR